MKEHVFRLIKGNDLKKAIVDYCLEENIKAGVIVSSVGCLDKCVLRNAGATEIKVINGPLEIISLNGTVSKNRIHLHLSVSDSDLKMFGGHLIDGCIVNTTTEIILLELNDYIFDKEFDINTGYYELHSTKLNK